jgi:DNA-binding MarR family transcriptional regulator
VPIELTTGEATTWAFIQRLSELAHAVVEQEVRASADLTGAEFDVLRLLLEADGALRQSELAAGLGWDKSRLSHQLTRMERRGLIERQDCPDDARGAFVVLSEAGREAIERAAPAHVETVRRLVFDGLDAEQVEALADITEGVLDRIGAHRAAAR